MLVRVLVVVAARREGAGGAVAIATVVPALVQWLLMSWWTGWEGLLYRRRVACRARSKCAGGDAGATTFLLETESQNLSTHSNNNNA